MTACELIEVLSMLDPEVEVLVSVGGWSGTSVEWIAPMARETWDLGLQDCVLLSGSTRTLCDPAT